MLRWRHPGKHMGEPIAQSCRVAACLWCRWIGGTPFATLRRITCPLSCRWVMPRVLGTSSLSIVAQTLLSCISVLLPFPLRLSHALHLSLPMRLPQVALPSAVLPYSVVEEEPGCGQQQPFLTLDAMRGVRATQGGHRGDAFFQLSTTGLHLLPPVSIIVIGYCAMRLMPS